MAQLIIIRGNSGSGKSTVSRALREALGGRVALIELDHFRRIVLKEKEGLENRNILDLLRINTKFAISRGYRVILEGIFSSHKYRDLLCEFSSEIETLYFYMDVSFDETLRRHETRPIANEFGYEEMKLWYQERDLLGLNEEIIIPEESGIDETVDMIAKLACAH